MEKINFWELFKQAFNLSWKNKKLWWFGLIVGSGSGMSFNFPFSSKEKLDQASSFDQLHAFFTDHTALIIIGSLILMIIIIAFGLFKILAYSGLIRKLIAPENLEDSDFWGGIREGKKFFWRLFEIRLIFIFSSLVLMLILALPAVFLFSLHSYVLGAITILLALLILVPAFIIFFFLEKFGSLYVITSDLDLRASLEQGYKVFAKNIGPSIIMSLLFIPLNILVGIGMILSFLMISLPFVILGAILYALFSILGAVLAGILGGTILTIFLLLLRSFLGVFYNTAWFLFFKEIATVRKEAVEIKEESVIAEEIQPEKA